MKGVLTDPSLSVHRGTQVLATNDNWSSSATLAPAFAAVGAFPLADPGRDSALLDAFPAGAYSVHISGANGETGIALMELYDASASSPGAKPPRLVNLSARAHVGVGADILIAGFAIGGATSKTLLIRAVGSSLRYFGVTNTIADPQLRIFSGPRLIASNDNWETGTGVYRAREVVGAFPLNSSDAALLVSLAPGTYSAQVSGTKGEVGIGLIEIYELP